MANLEHKIIKPKLGILMHIIIVSLCIFIGMIGYASEASEQKSHIKAVKQETSLSGKSAFNPSKDIVINGVIVSFDMSAMVRDGDGILRILTNDKETMTVLIPSGEARPQAVGLDLLYNLNFEEERFVEIKGEVIAPNKIRVYRSSHYIK